MGNPNQATFADQPVGKVTLTDSAGNEYNSGNPLPSSATITTGDIEIGAVELKNGSDDTRGTVTAANTARTTATTVVSTQDIDEAGNVLGRTAANTARTTATKVAPVQIVDAAGNVLPANPIEGRTAASTVTSVASSATNVTLLASNAARRGAAFTNDSTQLCYVKVGSATASSTSYTVQMAPNDYYEAPYPVCTGIIDAIWASANGNMRITEW